MAGEIKMDAMHMFETLPERLLKASEVAQILNVSRAFAYQLMQQGKIRTVEIGSARRVRPEDLQKFIAEAIKPSMIHKIP